LDEVQAEVFLQDSKFIELVRANPMLWNEALGAFKDVQAWALAWESVGAHLPCPLRMSKILFNRK